MSYSQNQEDIFILNYFGDYKGTLLEIGANDGQTLSNSKLFIDNGWKALLFEPGSVFKDLYDLHKRNDNVRIFPFGIGDKEEKVKFYQSGAHIPNGTDKGLVSTCDFQETLRWPDVDFEEKTIELYPFSAIKEYAPFDFISIDAEGYDWKILQQINLEAVSCKALCIEWNSDPKLLELFTDYCNGFTLAVKNAENLIFAK